MSNEDFANEPSLGDILGAALNKAKQRTVLIANPSPVSVSPSTHVTIATTVALRDLFTTHDKSSVKDMTLMEARKLVDFILDKVDRRDGKVVLVIPD